MIRKFATVPGLRVVLLTILMTILVGAARVQAQQTQAQPSGQQPPDNQQSSTQKSSSQEPSAEEPVPVHKPKPRLYKNWSFNAGGGASLVTGTTKRFVRSGGGIAAIGAARNFSPYFGFRADFQWDDLPLRASSLEAAGAPGATSHAYSFMVDPIVNLPFTKVWSAYVLAGGAFYHRAGKLDSSTSLPGAGCDPFFYWWGPCYASALPVNGDFLKANVNEFGENFGGGVARKIRPNLEIYGEFRVLHGSRYNNTTDLRPITIGVRW